MGLFSKPKCPYCGSVVTPTGYSFPFPQYRCNNCIERNKEKKKIAELEKKINEIENNSQFKTNQK